MQEFFIISKRKISSEWSLNELKDEYYAIEYCEQELDIPEEFIGDVRMTNMGLELMIEFDVEDLEYDNDWYMQLMRIANHSSSSAMAS
jgi:hypothetical protein